MRLHELKPPAGSRRQRKRIGRGISAGQGKTSGRGQKGQFARTPGLRHGFEGGQMPLAQRLPKLRGFHNRFRKDYAVVNVSKLSRFEPGAVIDPDALRAAGLVSNSRDGVKVLGAGRLRIKVTVRVHRISAGARTAIEQAGGTVELLEAERPVVTPGADGADSAKKETAAEPAISAAEAPAIAAESEEAEAAEDPAEDSSEAPSTDNLPGSGTEQVNLLEARSQAMRIPELRRKLLFTRPLLLICRILPSIS